MRDIKACLVCFTSDVLLYNMDKNQLRQHYNLLTGLQIKKSNGMPGYLCYQCSSYLKRFIKFRDKCHKAYFILEELLQNEHEIKEERLEAIERDSIGVKPYLSYLDVNKAHYEQHKFQWVKNNRYIISTTDVIPVVTHTTLTKEEMFEETIPNGNLIIEIKELDNNRIKEESGDVEIDYSTDYDAIQYEQNADNTQMSDDDNFADSYGEGSNQNIPHRKKNIVNKSNDQEADGSVLETEYATMHAISRNEAQAAVEVMKMISAGKFKCDICNRSYHNENRLKVHLRMHDQYVSGKYVCEICKMYYKSSFLLKTHMTEKHMYKYVCKKCPEVNFDRASAKQHYVLTHLQRRNISFEEWDVSRPSWMSKKGGKRIKGVTAVRPKAKRVKLPDDFLIYTPVKHEEQYLIIQERQYSRNYLESKFKCNLCYRGFREQDTYSKHMRKHDPKFSGELECDMCKLHFKNERKMYKHMTITHLYKFACQLCSYVCFNKGQAHYHYKFHKNVTYKCSLCPMEFKKLSTRLTHIRLKHPSSFICNMCGHSFVSDSGLYCHKQMAHTPEEIEASIQIPVDKRNSSYCDVCDIQFMSEDAFETHLGSSKNHVNTNQSLKTQERSRSHRRRAVAGRPRRHAAPSEVLNNGQATSTSCEICNKFLVNDVQARKHYESEHPGAEYLKRYMCDVCGHTTRQYANLMVHMRTHTNEKPYQCPHCDRRFSMPSNRDRHLVVHTGEKRYQCHHCNRRFTQSSAVKLHIQTVHLKIPYAPWDKKNRKRRKELEGTSAPVSTVNPVIQTQPKIVIDQYLNAYINYNDE